MIFFSESTQPKPQSDPCRENRRWKVRYRSVVSPFAIASIIHLSDRKTRDKGDVSIPRR